MQIEQARTNLSHICSITHNLNFIHEIEEVCDILSSRNDNLFTSQGGKISSKKGD